MKLFVCDIAVTSIRFEYRGEVDGNAYRTINCVLQHDKFI